MWLAIGLFTMMIMFVTALVIISKKVKHVEYIIYGSALFIPIFLFASWLYALIAYGGDMETPIFGIDTAMLGLPSGDISNLFSCPWYGQILFIVGGIWFFWCIMAMLLSFLGLLGGGLRKVPSLFDLDHK